MESLENQKHRNNIRINGIPEEPNETWDDIERKAKMALESKLNLPFQVEIKRAYGTGKGNRRSSDENASVMCPHMIICCLVSWKQKDLILKAARIEKPEGMFATTILPLKLFKDVKTNCPSWSKLSKPEKLPTSYWINW